MSKRLINSVPPIKCDNLFYSVPRSICAASVANCIIKRCHQTYPSGYIMNPSPQRQYLEWKSHCSKIDDFCNKHDNKDVNDLQPIQAIRRK